MGAIQTKTFKSGNSVAVRLPKGFAIPADAEVALEQRGRNILIRPLIDPDAEKAKLRKLVAMLDEIGPVGEIEERDPDIFPDRPGLY